MTSISAALAPDRRAPDTTLTVKPDPPVQPPRREAVVELGVLDLILLAADNGPESCKKQHE